MKKAKLSNYSFQLIVFIIVIFIINMFSQRIFHRFDFTKNKIYTLSDASKKALTNLEDKVLVKAFFSRNLPGQLSETQRFTEDILSEFSAFSNGNFVYEFLDPSESNEVLEEAKIRRIPPMQVQVTSKGKVEVREVFLGLSFLYQGEEESIPVVKSTRGLEYDITTMLKRLTSQQKNKVGLYVAPENLINSMQGGDSYQILRQILQRDNEVIDVNLFDPIPEDISTLVFTGVKDSLGVDLLYNLDQFVMKGGNLLVFQDAVDVVLQNQKATKIESDIFALLYKYGIRTRNNLVRDSESGSLTITTRRGMFSIPVAMKYPLFPIVNNKANDNLIVKNLENLQFIFASEIDTTFVNDNISMTPLLRSSKRSTASYGPEYKIDYKLYAGERDYSSEFKVPYKVMAVLNEGKFESYFKDQVLDGFRIPEVLRENGKVIFVSDADFIRDETTGMNNGDNSNVDFVLNAVDYLSGHKLLISLRNRETQYKPLKELSPGVRQIVKYLNLFIPSLLLIIIGLIFYRNQMLKRKMLRMKYEK